MIPVANINISTATFNDLYLKVNEIAAVLSAQTLTANAYANGATAIGNSYLNGIFAADTGAFGAIRGGNCQSSNTLTVSSNVLQQYCYWASGNAGTTNTNPTQTVDSFSSIAYRSSKYVLQITNASNYQATELLVTHDGTNVYVTEYATLSTNGNLGTFTAVIASNNVQLQFTPVNAVNVLKFERKSIAI